MTDDLSPNRVLHVTECLEGGVGQAITRWVNQSNSPEVEHFVLGRVRITNRTSTYPFDFEEHRGLLALAMRYRRLLRDWDPDIVHIHSTKAGIIFRILSTKGRTVIYSPHCYAFNMKKYSKSIRSFLRAIEKLLSFRTDFVVAVSPFEARIAGEISAKSCTVLLQPNIANPSKLESLLPHHTRPNVVMRIRAVGRYCPQKNPGLMKVILDQLPHRQISHEFKWIGSPDNQDTIPELPISGWLSQNEVESEIHSASLLLHTASWEAGVPLVALDSISLGTPVIMLRLPEYEGILTSGLFDSVEEASALLTQSQNESFRTNLLFMQREEIDAYLRVCNTGELSRIYKLPSAL